MEVTDGYLHLTRSEAVQIKWFQDISLLSIDPDATQFIEEVQQAFSTAIATNSDAVQIINNPESRHFLAKRILSLCD